MLHPDVVNSLPCWLSQFSWDSQQGRVRTTSILVRAFWNFKLEVLRYPRNCSLHNNLIPWSLTNHVFPNIHICFCLFVLVLKVAVTEVNKGMNMINTHNWYNFVSLGKFSFYFLQSQNKNIIKGFRTKLDQLWVSVVLNIA